MTSTVTARTRPETDLGQLLRALFPCGSITGAPKLKAMEVIAELERTPRGAYCGAIGVVRPGGAASFNVAIRTVTIDRDRGSAECGLGGGITWDSSADEEYEEVLTKARFLRRSAEDFDLLETMLLEDGGYWLLERHLSRLARSAAYFGFATPDDELRTHLARYAAAHAPGRRRVRLLYGRSGNVHLESSPLEQDTPAGRLRVALARAPVPRSETWLYHKTTRRSVYEAHTDAAAPGMYDVLLWNEEGELTEFTRGNLVVELDGKRCTPPVACGLLDGTLRQELLARGEICERVIRREALPRTGRIWFINSVRGWVEVELADMPAVAGARA